MYTEKNPSKRVRGRPFDPEGGGWHFWSGQIIHFHHGFSRKIYFRVNRGQNIYFQPQQIWGVGQDMAFYICKTFCRLLARNIAYLVAGMF